MKIANFTTFSNLRPGTKRLTSERREIQKGSEISDFHMKSLFPLPFAQMRKGGKFKKVVEIAISSLALLQMTEKQCPQEQEATFHVAGATAGWTV